MNKIEKLAEIMKSDPTGYVHLMEFERKRIAATIIAAGYLPVEEAKVEGLTRDELIKLINSTLEWAGGICPHCDREEPPMRKADCTKCYEDYISQFTFSKLQQGGKLYRVKE